MRKIDNLDLFKSKKAGISIIVILHLVGVAGFLSPLSEWFVFLTPVNLIITSGMIWIDSREGNKLGWPIALAVILLGYGIEVVGVKTGVLFGTYSYGEVLGWKILEVPPLIGINWLIVIWASYSVVVHMKIPKGFRWFVTALLAVALDYIIEPVAVHFEFWQWEGGIIPTRNFIAWFGVAAIMGAIFEGYPLVQKPRLGLVTYVCQALFFGILYLAIT